MTVVWRLRPTFRCSPPVAESSRLLCPRLRIEQMSCRTILRRIPSPKIAQQAGGGVDYIGQSRIVMLARNKGPGCRSVQVGLDGVHQAEQASP